MYRSASHGALWLTTTHNDRRILNTAMLQELRRVGAPTIHVWAHHARPTRQNSQPCIDVRGPLNAMDRLAAYTHRTGENPDDKPPKVEPLLRLAIGARVCLTENDRRYARLDISTRRLPCNPCAMCSSYPWSELPNPPGARRAANRID